MNLNEMFEYKIFYLNYFHLFLLFQLLLLLQLFYHSQEDFLHININLLMMINRLFLQNFLIFQNYQKSIFLLFFFYFFWFFYIFIYIWYKFIYWRIFRYLNFIWIFNNIKSNTIFNISSSFISFINLSLNFNKSLYTEKQNLLINENE